MSILMATTWQTARKSLFKLSVLATAVGALGLTACATTSTPSPTQPSLSNKKNLTAAESEYLDSDSLNQLEELLYATDMRAVEGDRLLILKHGDVWKRLAVGFRMNLDTVSHSRISAQRNWFASRQMYLDRLSARASRYLFYTVREAERRGMPTELALLPVIESSYDPAATSSAAAAGLWQFIPSTGRAYGLNQTTSYDGRRDVVASTQAAYDFLQALYNQFGSWELALAAYNAGPGTIDKAIKRNQAAGLPTDFWSLRLPKETMDYVPRFIAVAQIVKRPADYGVSLPPIANRPHFREIRLSQPTDLNYIASVTGLDRAELYALNPGYRGDMIDTSSPMRLLIPADLNPNIDARLRGTTVNTYTAAITPPRQASLTPQNVQLSNNRNLPALNTSVVPSTKNPPQMVSSTVTTTVNKASAIPVATQETVTQVVSQANQKASALTQSTNTLLNQGMPAKVTPSKAEALPTDVLKSTNDLTTAAMTKATPVTTTGKQVINTPIGQLEVLTPPVATSSTVQTSTPQTVSSKSTSELETAAMTKPAPVPVATTDLTPPPVTSTIQTSTPQVVSSKPTSELETAAMTKPAPVPVTTTTSTTGKQIIDTPVGKLEVITPSSVEQTTVKNTVTPPPAPTTSVSSVTTELETAGMDLSSAEPISTPPDNIDLAMLETNQTVAEKTGKELTKTFTYPTAVAKTISKDSDIAKLNQNKTIIRQDQEIIVVHPKGKRSTYTVRTGDNLTNIAMMHGVSLQDIVQWNKIDSRAALKAGTVLYLYDAKPTKQTSSSTPSSYTVQSGDTLIGVARRFSLTPKQLAEYNQLTPTASLRTGQKLSLIPTKATAPQTTAPVVPRTTGKMTTQSYTVKRGETLTAIATRYNLTNAQLAELTSGISPLTSLREGQKINVPTSKAVKPVVEQKEVKVAPVVKKAPEIHVVKSGETLTSIAKLYHLQLDYLAGINNLDRQSQVRTGQQLKLTGEIVRKPQPVVKKEEPKPTPAPVKVTAKTERHTVKSGESLNSIARQSGISVAELAKMNNLSSQATLQLGQNIVVPKSTGKTAVKEMPKPATKEVVKAKEPEKKPAAKETTKVKESEKKPAPAKKANAKTVSYKVKRGDTLNAIASKYGVSAAELAKMNGLKSGESLKSDSTIQVPNK